MWLKMSFNDQENTKDSTLGLGKNRSQTGMQDQIGSWRLFYMDFFIALLQDEHSMKQCWGLFVIFYIYICICIKLVACVQLWSSSEYIYICSQAKVVIVATDLGQSKSLLKHTRREYYPVTVWPIALLGNPKIWPPSSHNELNFIQINTFNVTWKRNRISGLTTV